MSRSLIRLVLIALVAVCVLGATSTAQAYVSTGDGGWLWQLPLPQGNALHDVCFIDASTGWAVGDAGTILKTSDGGATWLPQPGPVTDDLQEVDFVSDQLGWARSWWGVLRTRDGGSTWTELTALSDLRAFEFVDEQHGWAAMYGTLLTTTDGGDTWDSSVPPGLSSIAAVSDIAFADAQNGWMVGGSRGKVLHTIDGGATWEIQSIPATPIDESAFWDVECTDALHAWAVGPKLFAYTADGGATWVLCSYDKTGYWASDELTGLSMRDQSTGWVLAYDGTVRRTDDGGATWATCGNTGIGGYDAFDFVDGFNGWVVSWDGSIARTSDGGVTWAPQSTSPVVWNEGSNGFLRDVAAVSATHIIAVGDGILTSSDGGASWSFTSNLALPLSDPYGTLGGVSFPTADLGWVVGQYGDIIHTGDGGSTWTSQYVAPLPLWSVSFPDAKHGWAVGEGGIIVATANSGATWKSQRSGVDVFLDEVDFVDARHGYAVGDAGTVLATRNGGRTWMRVAVPMTEPLPLMAVDFVTPKVGWVSGTSGVDGVGAPLFKTVNGGRSWTAQDPGGHYYFEHLCFVDALNGYAVGAADVLRTSDGGQTWTWQWAGASSPIISVDAFDAQTAWIVGQPYKILFTQTGGFAPAAE